MAPGQLASMLNVRPLSRASLAPTGEAANCGRAQVLCPLKIHCGSKACSRWRWVSYINAECQAAFASKPAHTGLRSEEHTSELQSLMRISYAVFCLKKKRKQITPQMTETATIK